MMTILKGERGRKMQQAEFFLVKYIKYEYLEVKICQIKG